MTEIAGQVAVVTGGGSGIGRGLCLALSAAGAGVVVADIIKDNADAVAAEIRKTNASAVAVACDVCDRGSVRQLHAEANRTLGKVSLLFANAGATSFERLVDMSDDDVDWIVQVNLNGVINCLRVFLPDMIAARAGHVVATASMAGMLPAWIPYHAPYSAAKMGVIGLFLNMRTELAEAGIYTTVYCPGGVQSGMKDNNLRYRPQRFGGPRNEGVRVPEGFFQHEKVNFLPPEAVAPMVLQAVRNNRPIVLDHADQRKIFMDTYVNPVLEAFDDVELYEKEAAPAR